jgi:hypothetical protein
LEPDVRVALLDSVDCLLLLLLEVLLCTIASAATNTERIPGNFFLTISIITISIVESASESIASITTRQ